MLMNEFMDAVRNMCTEESCTVQKAHIEETSLVKECQSTGRDHMIEY